MAKHPRVMVKVSAFYALGKKTPPYNDLNHLIYQVYQAFGPERLMWASDCPYQVVDHTYQDSIGLITDRLDFLSEKDKDQILGKTAEDFFFQN
jgi:predicted TIM-barrel fold metal-dependent hydrolase